MRIKKVLPVVIAVLMLLNSSIAAFAADNLDVNGENIGSEAEEETIGESESEETISETESEETNFDGLEESSAETITESSEEEESVIEDETVNASDLESLDSYAATAMPGLQYSVHGQDYGWQAPVTAGNVGGMCYVAKRVEGIKISLNNPAGINGSIQYRACVEGDIWQDWVENGQLAGTAGKAQYLEAIQIRLTGELAEKYDIYYRIHSRDYGWLDWASNGMPAGTTGCAKRAEAIIILLVRKGESAPGATDHPFVEKKTLGYRAHVQNYSWQDWKFDGELSGTAGEAKRMEAFKIKLNSYFEGNIQYIAYVQNYGWLDWVENGAVAGTTGEAKRMEAIRIKLDGEIADHYDIYYRTHIQDYGWTGWAANGQICGSMGLAKRMEAIQVKLVKKGEPAPGSTADIYYTITNPWGIDVSAWQGSINWPKVKADGVEFAMIRATTYNGAGKEVDGETIYLKEDGYLKKNLQGALVNGIPVGAYVYNYASTPEEAAAEAKFVVSLLKGYAITYPVVFDLEEEEHMTAAAKLNNMAMAQAFCNVIREAGYKPMVYGSPSKLRTCFDYKVLSSTYDIWLARYRWGDDVMDFNDSTMRQEVERMGYEGGNYTGLSNVKIWQFTDSGKVDGISGYTDLDLGYKRYY